MPNMYASAVCSGKITPGGKKGKRTKKAEGGMVEYYKGGVYWPKKDYVHG